MPQGMTQWEIDCSRDFAKELEFFEHLIGIKPNLFIIKSLVVHSRIMQLRDQGFTVYRVAPLAGRMEILDTRRDNGLPDNIDPIEEYEETTPLKVNMLPQVSSHVMEWQPKVGPIDLGERVTWAVRLGRQLVEATMSEELIWAVHPDDPSRNHQLDTGFNAD